MGRGALMLLRLPDRWMATARMVVALAVIVMTAGCSEEPELAPDDQAVDHFAIDRTDPLAVVEGHRRAWSMRSLNILSGLLTADYEFFPRDRDAGDFAWMTGESWDRDTEVGMAANMFDPAFVGDGSGTVRPVERIEMTQTFRSQRDLEGGVVEITTAAEIIVWFNTTDGLHTESIFVYELQPSRLGLYFIRSLRERELLARGVGPAVMSPSWAAIKAIYRL